MKNYDNYQKLYKSKRFEISKSLDRSLMVYHTHYYIDWVDEFDLELSKCISLHFGGLVFKFRYGHNFLQPTKTSEDAKTRYYGLSSREGEYFWKDFWWGRKLYDNPIAPVKFIGSYIYDMYSNKLIPKRHLDKYSKEFDKNIVFPYVDVLRNTNYTCADNTVSNVEEIKFWVEILYWTLPILHWLHLDWLYKRKMCYLSFDSTGIGVDDDWKGQVSSSAVNLTIDEPEIEKIITLTRRECYRPEQLDIILKKKVHDFMNYEKTY